MTADGLFRPGRASGLATWAALGVAVYVVIDVSLAFLRPGESLLHDAESNYGVGPYSWLMDINFLVRCALSLALAAVLLREVSPRARAAAWLLAGFGVGSGVLAFFPDDPPGYPVTASGQVHLVVAAIAFICVAVAAIWMSLDSSRSPRLAPLRAALLSLSLVALLALLLLGRTDFRLSSLAGLYERLFLGLELLWMLLVALRLRSSSDPSPEALGQPR